MCIDLIDKIALKLTFNNMKFRKIAQKLKIKIISKKINSPRPYFFGAMQPEAQKFFFTSDACK